METKYLIRLDDACPTMHKDNWDKMEKLLRHYNILPMVGVIPANADPNQNHDECDPHFWLKVRRWKEEGWTIALHGYDHLYISESSGFNPMWRRSEFAGVSLEEQKNKIKNGVEIMRMHDLNPKYFFAPSHTFDNNTLIALQESSDIRIISDTIALKPYTYKGFIFIPQIGGHCFNLPLSGIFTFCFHPSTMTEHDFVELSKFLHQYKDKFCGFHELELTALKSKSLIDKFLSWAYFAYRKLRRIS